MKTLHVNISPDVLMRLKVYAAEHGVTMGAVVEGMLEEKLRNGAALPIRPVEEARPVKVEPVAAQSSSLSPQSLPDGPRLVSECCGAEIVRNAKNFRVCRKCGKPV